MPYVYLTLSVFFLASGSIFGGFYNRKNEERRGTAPLYNLILMCSVLLGWGILFLTAPSFDAGVLPYAIGFGAAYTLCQLGLINALRTGPVALTSLLLQLSLIGVTAWGFFFWDAPFTLPVGIGLLLVAISLWLCLYPGKRGEKTGERISLKWLIFAMMAFVGNAGCSIIQRTQQMKYEGQHGNLLMLIAIACGTVFALVQYLRSDRTDTRVILKSSALFPVGAGVCNMLLNLFMILLATSPISPNLIYPVIAVGGLAVTSLFSLLAFKEKLRWWQWVGIAVGAAAVALLSL